MGLKLKNQKGFTLVEGLLIILIVTIVGFASWYVWGKQKSNKEIVLNENAQTTNINTSKFTNDQEIYDKIKINLTASSNNIVVGEQTFDSPDILQRKFTPNTMEYPQGVQYISSKSYSIRKSCSSNCEELLTDEGHLSGAYLLGENDLNIIFYGVKESFINQPGVGLIDSGTKPETYIASNYFIVSITKSDGSKINLQVATGANDGGENIQAYLY